jgi:hypothetical protein
MSRAVTLCKGRLDRRSRLSRQRCTFENNSSYLGSNSVLGETVLNCHNSVCLFDALDDSGSIQRFYAPQVNYLGLNTLFSQLLCSCEGELDITGVAYYCYVPSRSHYLGFSNWNEEVRAQSFFGNIESLSIKVLILQEYHWIVSSDG